MSQFWPEGPSQRCTKDVVALGHVRLLRFKHVHVLCIPNHMRNIEHDLVHGTLLELVFRWSDEVLLGLLLKLGAWVKQGFAGHERLSLPPARLQCADPTTANERGAGRRHGLRTF